MHETTVTVVGNVISDPRHKITMDNVELATFRMASNARRFDKEQRQWVDGKRVFVDVVCWRKLASTVQAVLEKGDPVIVTGRLHTREYEVDGKRRSTTEMESTAIGLDLARIPVTPHRRRREGQTGDALVAQMEPASAAIDPPQGGTPPDQARQLASAAL